MPNKFSTIIKWSGLIFASSLLSGTGLATSQIQIPGTSASYSYQRSGKANNSVIFLKSDSDPSGKTYIANYCDFGALLFSRLPLSKKKGAEVIMDLQEESDQEPSINLFYGKVRQNKTDGQLTVWEPIGKSEGDFWDYTRGEGAPFTLVVKRVGLSPIKLHFNPKGLDKALTAVKICK